MLAFAVALPRVRGRVARDLGAPGLPAEKVMAALVRLLETTLIRVGNEEYARKNRSFGLTTLRTSHCVVDGTLVEFRFRGKSGKDHVVRARDRRLAAIVCDIRALPGRSLFQYVDARGRRRAADSDDVNAYLRRVTGRDFTAKDFRTWAATVLAASGCHLVLFTTGRGTPFGTVVPTMKISTNDALAKNKPHWIDWNAMSNPDTEAFAAKVIAVASGESAANERFGAKEIAIFKDGVTL
jgi:DNA topoisomerase IB